MIIKKKAKADEILKWLKNNKNEDKRVFEQKLQELLKA
jgi:hypothetical protein